MATVHLEFDLDSDVYPELHQALSALRSAAARAERLRQLATLGLVWENVRIYGAEAIGPTLGAPVPVTAPAPVPVSAPVVAASPAPRSGRAAGTKAGKSREGKAPRASTVLAELPLPDPRHPVPVDFVDLAIDRKRSARLDAGLGDDLDDPSSIPLSQSDLEEVANELPVLLDIVADTGSEADPPPLHRLPPTADEREGEPQEEAIHLTSLAHKPAMRSRLMRMKERGLFKNG